MRKLVFFSFGFMIILLVAFGCVNEKVVDIQTNDIAEDKKPNLDKSLLQSQDMKILQPTQKSIYKEDILSIVIEVNSSKIDQIKLYQENGSSFDIETKQSKDIYCKTIKLLLGKNKIAIFGYKDEQKVSLKTINVYYSMDVMKRYSFAPKEYEKSFFHTDQNEKLCKTCHEEFKNPKELSCKTCHNSLTKRKFVHIASKKYKCTSCHDGKTDRRNRKFEGKSKYLTVGTVSKACLSCHKDKNAPKWFDKKYQHDPAEGGSCNKCHNPHSSENRFFIRKEPYKLCGNCHSEKLIKGHVIHSFTHAKEHPVHGVDDPSRKGEELSCIGCHDPHASNHEFFLRKDQKSLCLICHKK